MNADVKEYRRRVTELEAEVADLRATIERVREVEDDWSNRILTQSAWPHIYHWLRDLRAALGES